MLPLNNLLSPELPSSDNLLKNNNLLSEDATVPDAVFGDLLTANLVELTDPVPPSGEALPLNGNALPLEPGASAAGADTPELAPLLPKLPAAAAQAEHTPGLLVAPAAGGGGETLSPAASTAQPIATVAMGPADVAPETLLAAEQGAPRSVDAAASAQPADVRLQPQPRAATIPAEMQAVLQQARGAGDPGLSRTAETAAIPLTSGIDAVEQSRSPGESTERLPQSLVAARLAADTDAPPSRVLDAGRDDAAPGIRALQQLNQQVQPSQQLQQPQAIAMLNPATGGPAQASPLPTAPAPTAETLLSVNTPVSDTAWGERIGERVVMMAGRQVQNAEIRLSPAELGPLRVQVRVDDGAANITFHASHPVTRDAIEQAMPRLREMFIENGLNLGQANVNEQGIGSRSDTGHDGPGQSPLGGAEEGEAAIDGTVDAAAPETRSRRLIDGLVDTFA